MARIVCDKYKPDRSGQSSEEDGQSNSSATTSDGIRDQKDMNDVVATSDKDRRGILESQVYNRKHHKLAMLESEVNKIRQYLEDRKNDHDVDEAMKEVEEAPLQEWREAARIIDKFFFWLYLFMNTLLMVFFTLKSIL